MHSADGQAFHEETDIGLTPTERQLAGLAETNTPLHFDAVLRPHRSLSRRGYLILLVSVCGISLLAITRFLMLGAWPVAAMFFLDAALIWGAFQLSYATGRGFEAIQLSDDSLIVTRVNWRGRAKSWSFNPYWVRLVETDGGCNETQVLLQEGRKRALIGTSLSEVERKEFARALRHALNRPKGM